LEMACARVLTKIEHNGLRIDRPYIEDSLVKLHKKKIDLAGVLAENGIVSANKSAELLAAFDRLGLAVPDRKSRTGGQKMDEAVLVGILGPNGKIHPLAEAILDYRYVSRNIQTYFNKFLEYADGDMLHPHINQLEARSGRMAVTDPALHAVEKSSVIRDAFIAGEGNKLILIDYSNEELRLAASNTHCKNMIEAFASGADMHRGTAALAFNKAEKDVTDYERQKSKRAMFSKVYGGGSLRFATYMGLQLEESDRIFAALSKRFPELDQEMTRLIAQVRGNQSGGFGWITLSDNRRIYVPVDRAYSSMAYRTQGEGSIVLKRSIVRLDAAGLGDFIRLPVHDENMLDVPDEDVPEVARLATEVMETDEYIVRLTTDCNIVTSWGEKYRGAERDVAMRNWDVRDAAIAASRGKEPA